MTSDDDGRAYTRRLSGVGSESEARVANANPLEGAREIQSMLVDYAKQETIDPLKSLGRFLAWGLAGAVSVFLGVFFLSLGVLRLMQTWFDGSHIGSAVPYAVALVALAVSIGVIYVLFSRSKKRVLS